MSDSSLGRVVRSLRLWNIDNGTGHTANKHHASWSLTLYQVFCNGNCKQVCSIHVNTPEFSNSVDWVVDGFKILGETSRCHQVINFSVLGNDFGNSSINGFLRRDICVMSGNLWNPKMICKPLVTRSK